eukprot:g1543.t1
MGFAAACAAEASTLPADTLKVRLQLDPLRKKYKDIMDAGSKIIRREGIQAFYAGLPAGLLRAGVMYSVRLSLFDDVSETLTRLYTDQRSQILQQKTAKSTPSPGEALFINLIAAIPVTCVSVACANPFDVLKVRFQRKSNGGATTGLAGKLTNLGSAHPMQFYHIIKNEGFFKGLYSGFFANLLRNCLVGSSELVAYKQTKALLLDRGHKDNLNTQLASSLVAGFTAAVIGSPCDCLGTRLMQKEVVESRITTLQLTRDMLKNEGLQAFYKGFLPNWTRLSAFNREGMSSKSRGRGLVKGPLGCVVELQSLVEEINRQRTPSSATLSPTSSTGTADFSSNHGSTTSSVSSSATALENHTRPLPKKMFSSLCSCLSEVQTSLAALEQLEEDELNILRPPTNEEESPTSPMSSTSSPRSNPNNGRRKRQVVNTTTKQMSLKCSRLEILTEILVDDSLIHSHHKEIRLLTAACFVDILRIYAPEAPYETIHMRAIFKLIIQQLATFPSEKNSTSYLLCYHILESLATVQSCVLVVYDLELETENNNMSHERTQKQQETSQADKIDIFGELVNCLINTLCPTHHSNVFNHMVDIITACFDEVTAYDDITQRQVDALLRPLLTRVQDDNDIHYLELMNAAKRKSVLTGKKKKKSRKSGKTMIAAAAAVNANHQVVVNPGHAYQQKTIQLSQNLVAAVIKKLGPKSLFLRASSAFIVDFLENNRDRGSSLTESKEDIHFLIYQYATICDSDILLYTMPCLQRELSVEDVGTRRLALELLGRLFGRTDISFPSYSKLFELAYTENSGSYAYKLDDFDNTNDVVVVNTNSTNQTRPAYFEKQNYFQQHRSTRGGRRRQRSSKVIQTTLNFGRGSKDQSLRNQNNDHVEENEKENGINQIDNNQIVVGSFTSSPTRRQAQTSSSTEAHLFEYHFEKVFEDFLRRFHDTSPQIRKRMLELSVDIIEREVYLWESSESKKRQRRIGTVSSAAAADMGVGVVGGTGTAINGRGLKTGKQQQSNDTSSGFFLHSRKILQRLHLLLQDRDTEVRRTAVEVVVEKIALQKNLILKSELLFSLPKAVVTGTGALSTRSEALSTGTGAFSTGNVISTTSTTAKMTSQPQQKTCSLMTLLETCRERMSDLQSPIVCRQATRSIAYFYNLLNPISSIYFHGIDGQESLNQFLESIPFHIFRCFALPYHGSLNISQTLISDDVVPPKEKKKKSNNHTNSTTTMTNKKGNTKGLGKSTKKNSTKVKGQRSKKTKVTNTTSVENGTNSKRGSGGGTGQSGRSPTHPDSYGIFGLGPFYLDTLDSLLFYGDNVKSFSLQHEEKTNKSLVHRTLQRKSLVNQNTTTSSHCLNSWIHNFTDSATWQRNFLLDGFASLFRYRSYIRELLYQFATLTQTILVSERQLRNINNVGGKNVRSGNVVSNLHQSHGGASDLQEKLYNASEKRDRIMRKLVVQMHTIRVGEKEESVLYGNELTQNKKSSRFFFREENNNNSQQQHVGKKKKNTNSRINQNPSLENSVNQDSMKKQAYLQLTQLVKWMSKETAIYDKKKQTSSTKISSADYTRSHKKNETMKDESKLGQQNTLNNVGLTMSLSEQICIVLQNLTVPNNQRYQINDMKVYETMGLLLQSLQTLEKRFQIDNESSTTSFSSASSSSNNHQSEMRNTITALETLVEKKMCLSSHRGIKYNAKRLLIEYFMFKRKAHPKLLLSNKELEQFVIPCFSNFMASSLTSSTNSSVPSSAFSSSSQPCIGETLLRMVTLGVNTFLNNNVLLTLTQSAPQISFELMNHLAIHVPYQCPQSLMLTCMNPPKLSSHFHKTVEIEFHRFVIDTQDDSEDEESFFDEDLYYDDDDSGDDELEDLLGDEDHDDDQMHLDDEGLKQQGRSCEKDELNAIFNESRKEDVMDSESGQVMDSESGEAMEKSISNVSSLQMFLFQCLAKYSVLEYDSNTIRSAFITLASLCRACALFSSATSSSSKVKSHHTMQRQGSNKTSQNIRRSLTPTFVYREESNTFLSKLKAFLVTMTKLSSSSSSSSVIPRVNSSQPAALRRVLRRAILGRLVTSSFEKTPDKAKDLTKLDSSLDLLDTDDGLDLDVDSLNDLNVFDSELNNPDSAKAAMRTLCSVRTGQREIQAVFNSIIECGRNLFGGEETNNSQNERLQSNNNQNQRLQSKNSQNQRLNHQNQRLLGILMKSLATYLSDASLKCHFTSSQLLQLKQCIQIAQRFILQSHDKDDYAKRNEDMRNLSTPQDSGSEISTTTSRHCVKMVCNAIFRSLMIFEQKRNKSSSNSSSHATRKKKRKKKFHDLFSLQECEKMLSFLFNVAGFKISNGAANGRTSSTTRSLAANTVMASTSAILKLSRRPFATMGPTSNVPLLSIQKTLGIQRFLFLASCHVNVVDHRAPLYFLVPIVLMIGDSTKRVREEAIRLFQHGLRVATERLK